MTNSSRIYYVNQMTGSDANDGLSKEHPFASLFRINQISLQPGDQVLLAGGSSFAVSFTAERQRNEGSTNCNWFL